MLLADMGADVLRIDRAADVGKRDEHHQRFDVYGRNKRSVALDLKKPEGVAAALRLIDAADALIDPFRPGVVERLGIGPDVCLARNPRLVYGRMTGWGQTGPLASIAGHDLNYIALTGALHSIGRSGEAPVPPLNLVGDFGGGALYLALGLVSAMLEARNSGIGQVVDAAMIDGAASLMTGTFAYLQSGLWSRERGRNFLDGGAPYYDSYETSDGRYVAIAAIEPRFYAELIARLGISRDELPPQEDRSGWDKIRARFGATFKTKTRDEWCRVFEGSNACFAPVLDLDEVPRHPHNVARGVFVDVDGMMQPSPAPRFGRTSSSLRNASPRPGQDGRATLRDWGFSQADIAEVFACGAAREPEDAHAIASAPP
jgi:alpha-methylacyl-CoA racemase